MTLEENKNIVRRYQDAYNTNDLDALDQVLDAHFIGHAPIYPGMPAGLEGAKQAHRTNLALFPDFSVTIEDLVAEGDKVVMRFRAAGTHTGAPLFGIPPSGKHFEFTGMSMFRIANGKIVEHWANEDEMGLLRQLGVQPPMG